MKTVGIDEATLDACVRDARTERVIITRDGVPVALVVGLEGLDEEQVELGSDDGFWKLIAERRSQKTLDRGAMEQELARRDAAQQAG